MKKIITLSLLLLIISIGLADPLEIILKVKKEFQFGIDNLSTGNLDWDALNKIYCCTELKQLSGGPKSNENAEKLGLNRIYATRLACVNEDTASVIRSFWKTNCFEFIEVNEALKSTSAMLNEPFFPNDPYWDCQWPLHNTGIDLVDSVKADADIDIPEAWGIEQGDSSVIIAILDSGIKNWHNEFDGRLWINKKEIPDNGVDDDNNGYVDDVNGWNFIYGNNRVDDDRGHGTAMASIVGANVNNNNGMSGVNGKSKLLVIKVSDSLGVTNTESLINGIQYAVKQGVKVINVSFTNAKGPASLELYLKYAFEQSVVVCAASGNNNADSISYPAKFANVIAVGATGRCDVRCTSWMGKANKGGSSYGDSLDVMAPGDSISFMSFKNGSFPRDGGTSFATAYVTGLASLLISQDTSRTPDDIYKLITSTAEDQIGGLLEDTPGYDKYYGYGRINAYKALLAGQATLLHKKSKPAQLSVQVTNVCFVKNINQLHITLNNNNINQKSTAEFKLLTPQGRVVHSVNEVVSSNELSIALPHLSRGIYCYSIELNGNRHNGKFVF